MRRRFHTDLVTYIVHYNSWPFDDEDPVLKPPEDLDGGASGWLTVPLSDHEVNVKREAIHKYRSQMDVMDWFLDGFVRRTEVFSRPAPSRVTLPVAHSECEDFEDPPRKANRK